MMLPSFICERGEPFSFVFPVAAPRDRAPPGPFPSRQLQPMVLFDTFAKPKQRAIGILLPAPAHPPSLVGSTPLAFRGIVVHRKNCHTYRSIFP